MMVRMQRALGAHWDGTATEFGIRSTVAEAVELCLFDGAGAERRVEMTRDDHSFRARVDGVTPGAAYGFRVHGPWDPARGLRCNPAKLLLDPRALRMTGDVRFHPSIFGHRAEDPAARSELDSAPHTMRSVVVDTAFDWGDDRPPRIPTSEMVVYETHVKGITAAHPDVPADLRGTYSGLAHPAVIDHLVGLGVTSVELLPVHAFTHEPHLLAAGGRNYWGYNTVGFLAPHEAYAATDDPVSEFKTLVRALHEAGLEVLLDVVYTHTAEGAASGPTLSFRGIDNPAWYRLDPADPARYLNWTGTGNTLDFGKVEPLRLAMDSLRYWAEEMHVDGFRFDLATTLGRTRGPFDPMGAFFGAVVQDPALMGVKLIAEPWDVGPGGYQVGSFPRRWMEWNDRYRDTIRDFWKSTDGSLSVFATRITGSSDLYEGRGRRPTATVNYVTSHDGFTLLDLVSYDERHNHANGEQNRDGHPDNRSWNGGVEGPTDDPAVLALRRRRRRSILATVLLSQGVPMILGGDELGRTQDGNNNAYNQDGPLTWYDWSAVDEEFLEFTRDVVALRRSHPTFRRSAWLHEYGDDQHDHVGWFTPDGSPMTVSDWHLPEARAVGLYLAGAVVHAAGTTTADDDFVLLFNGGPDEVAFLLADSPEDWEVALDTTGTSEMADAAVPVDGFGLVVLRRPNGRLGQAPSSKR